MPKGIQFAFHLYLQNSDLALFTDLSEITAATAPTYTNAGMGAGNPVRLALVSRQAQATERFVVHQPATENAFTLSGRPLAGLTHADFIVEGLGAVNHPAHYETTAKIITVNSQAATQGDTFKVTYPTMPQRDRGVFADVEIDNNDSLPGIAAGPGEFEIAFDVENIKWAYYVVAKPNGAQFHIRDQGEPALLFSDGQRTDLSEHPDPADPIAKALEEQHPDKKRVRFVSDDPIPCRQRARKSIQLVLGDDPVLGTLPNPSLRNRATVQEEQVLFQMVKYFTH
jgi:hypothetical protein